MRKKITLKGGMKLPIKVHENEKDDDDKKIGGDNSQQFSDIIRLITEKFSVLQREVNQIKCEAHPMYKVLHILVVPPSA